MKTYTLYRLTVEDDPRAYVGITATKLNIRLSAHKGDARRGKNTIKAQWLREAISIGKAIRIEALYRGLSHEEAGILEQQLITEYQRLGLSMNMNPGGKPNWKSAHTPENREKARLAIQKANSKDWEVTSPLGVMFMVTNMKQFCREQNLDPGTMSQVARGKQANHKGWTCRKLEETGATAGAEQGCKSAA